MAIKKRSEITSSSSTSKMNGSQSLESQKAALLSNPSQHFSMVRNFYIADFLTLLNGACGSGSVLACLNYLVSNKKEDLWVAFILIPLGVFFDFLDGRVARWRNESSVLGQELDSLADLISFGLAPACLGYCIGLRGFFDQAILVYFVSCGIARLARYNATVALLPKDAKGKITYFEGTPIPTSLAIVLFLAYHFYYDNILDNLPLSFISIFKTKFHPISLIYAVLGSCMISRSLRIPKL
ncbi:CDP-diacylglycerol--serine O-phosphatidyltransferase [Neoconidiobolus thromboides FSU 785]|nr:CDP-diacylglycerol--serine O-phosphatidyltransferase [Neoconidiobolus thromboides FSU 785]